MELRAPNHIAEEKSNPGQLNSEELRKIYINLMEDEKEQASLILDSKTTSGFRENVVSEIVTTPLLSSISTSIFLITQSQHRVTILQKVLITILKCFVYSRTC